MSASFLKAAAALLVCAILGVGCSKKEKALPVYPVTGTVTYENKPVEGATVVFRNPAEPTSKVATGRTDANGRFTLMTYKEGDGAVAGDHEVTVTKFTSQASGEKLTMEDAAKQKSSPAKSQSEIPLKYSNAKTSKLKFTVSKSGDNDFKIELK
jgi:hypothetical protein